MKYLSFFLINVFLTSYCVAVFFVLCVLDINLISEFEFWENLLIFFENFPLNKSWVNMSESEYLSAKASDFFIFSIFSSIVSFMAPIIFIKHVEINKKYLFPIILIDIIVLPFFFKIRTDIPVMPSIHVLYASCVGFSFLIFCTSCFFYFVGVQVSFFIKNVFHLIIKNFL